LIIAIEAHEIDAKLFAEVRPERPELGTAIRSILIEPEIGQAIRKKFPNHKQYQRVRAALADYRVIEKNGGWGVLPVDPTLAQGATGAQVAALATRLQKSTDLAHRKAGEDEFDIE